MDSLRSLTQSALLLALPGVPACQPEGTPGAAVDPCAAAERPSSAAARCVGTVSGRIVDPQDRPVSGLLLSVCGDVCLSGSTMADGTFSVRADRFMTAPELTVPVGLTRYAPFALALGGAGDQRFDAPLRLWRLPEAGSAFPVAGAAAAVSSGGVTIRLSAATTVTVDALTFPAPADQLFRAIEVPVALAPPFVVPSLGLARLYGVGPLETTFNPPAPCRLPNAAGWPAGTRVEVLVHGFAEASGYGVFGSMGKVASAHVESDGESVLTDAGEGIARLSWIGLRIAP